MSRISAVMQLVEQRLLLLDGVEAHVLQVFGGGAQARGCRRNPAGRPRTSRAAAGTRRCRRWSWRPCRRPPGRVPSSPAARICRTARPSPTGPSILCAERARKSTSSALTLILRCGAVWAASSSTSEPLLVGLLDDLLGRDADPVQVGGIAQRDQLHLPVEHLLEGRQVEGVVGARGQDLHLHALLFGQHLPGDQVGVVLFVRDQHHVAGLSGRANWPPG